MRTQINYAKEVGSTFWVVTFKDTLNIPFLLTNSKGNLLTWHTKSSACKYIEYISLEAWQDGKHLILSAALDMSTANVSRYELDDYITMDNELYKAQTKNGQVYGIRMTMQGSSQLRHGYRRFNIEFSGN